MSGRYVIVQHSFGVRSKEVRSMLRFYYEEVHREQRRMARTGSDPVLRLKGCTEIIR
jgi:hypothetical protein